MFDAILAPLSPTVGLGDPRLLASLERASAAIARMDQALDGHPLLAAFLYRTRLEAVRRQAAVDGHGIDPWHLAAVLEGLRLRMDGALRIIDRGTIFDAARTALGHHQWLTAPDFDQEGEVAVAETHIAARPAPTALLTAALRLRSWLDQGGTRPPVRAALIRHWVRSGLLRAPVPLTGPRALSADAPEEPTEWTCAFLDAIAAEASDYHQMLRDLERGWTAARGKAAGRRCTSRASIAIDVLAAAPLLSATTLAGAIGMSIKAATELFDDFVDEGIAVEVTHRSARRLFGLIGMAPVREVTTAPRRPQPGRGRGRPAFVGEEDEAVQAAPSIPPPLTRFERPAIDYAALEEAMAQCEQLIRSTKRTLDRLRDGD